jgi:hypothetical protein
MMLPIYLLTCSAPPPSGEGEWRGERESNGGAGFMGLTPPRQWGGLGKGASSHVQRADAEWFCRKRVATMIRELRTATMNQGGPPPIRKPSAAAESVGAIRPMMVD